MAWDCPAKICSWYVPNTSATTPRQRFRAARSDPLPAAAPISQEHEGAFGPGTADELARDGMNTRATSQPVTPPR
ncbi:MAG TPA: hypothetical protein VIG49_05970 [Acetobacteraceae bacterium]